MAENVRLGSLLPLVRAGIREQAARMLPISCPTTGTRVLASLDAVRVTNHPDHIAVHVRCPACGGEHVRRTGRTLERARQDAALEVAVRRAVSPLPA